MQLIMTAACLFISFAAVRANARNPKSLARRSLTTIRAGATDDYLSSLSRPSMTNVHDQKLTKAAHAAVGSVNNPNIDTTSADYNSQSVAIARAFLQKACPSFLLSDVCKDEDRLIKIGRSLADLVSRSKEDEESATISDELEAGLNLLVEECSLLATGDIQVPKKRFGKTELMMPIVSLGCMRFQQAWGTSIESMDDVTPECQENLLSILRRSFTLGINHIETARGYGSSEMQIGEALKTLFENGEVKREDLIIQTKVPLRPTAAEFREVIEKSFRELQVDYVDLLGLHGLNLDEQYDLLYNNGDNGNLIDVVREYMAKGKVRHLGFSTHARPDLIRRFIETGDFEYCNLHYHWCGSYTASGDGQYGGNLEIIRLLNKMDLGVFIISAFDKGGMLYAPSKKLRSLTLPDLEPIAFGSHFLWQHQRFDADGADIHTISCGAARPTDLDQPAVGAHMHAFKPSGMEDRVDAIRSRLRAAEEAALGADWVHSWFQGLPNFLGSESSTHHGNIVWLYNLIHSFGMLEFAKARYASMENNSQKWDESLSNEENIKNLGPAWGWTPGIAIKPGKDYSADLIAVPETNKERVAESIEFIHKWCSKDQPEGGADDDDGASITAPKEWETAYDMRPWTAFPERR